MKRALNFKQLLKIKYHTLPIDGKWKAAFGELNQGSRICMYGHSGSGKSSFSLQLADYLAKFGKVCYNSIEMGQSSAMQAAVKKLGIEGNTNILITEPETYQEVITRMRRRRSPHALFIDSIDTFRHDDGRKVSFDDYSEMCRLLKNKIIVVISQARGNEPRSTAGGSIYYHADVKISIKGWLASVQSRYEGGGEHVIIWEERYNELTIKQ